MPETVADWREKLTSSFLYLPVVLGHKEEWGFLGILVLEDRPHNLKNERKLVSYRTRTGARAIKTIPTKAVQDYKKAVWAEGMRQLGAINSERHIMAQGEVHLGRDMDADTMLSAFYDALQGVVYRNDRQIIRPFVQKIPNSQYAPLTVVAFYELLTQFW